MQKANQLLSILFLPLFLCCFFSMQAQGKSHFRVLENGVEVQNTICHTAIAEMNMDVYRYSDARRQIVVEGSPYTVELFSGEELWNNYQKQISPLNHTIAQNTYPNLRLIVSGNRIKLLPE